MSVSYVKEKRGNLPYLVFFQSKGGWPSFEMVATLKDAIARQENFASVGVRVEIFHWMERDR